MERNIKCKPNHLCMIIFTFCLSVRFVEYFLIETDKTTIGENVLHKVIGIILLALVLKKVNLTWGDIGFQKNGLVSGLLKGLLLGSVCFAVSFCLELEILALQGSPAHNGADELQIVRILAAQIISFTFVIAIYYCKKRKLPLCDKGAHEDQEPAGEMVLHLFSRI